MCKINSLLNNFSKTSDKFQALSERCYRYTLLINSILTENQERHHNTCYNSVYQPFYFFIVCHSACEQPYISEILFESYKFLLLKPTSPWWVSIMEYRAIKMYTADFQHMSRKNALYSSVRHYNVWLVTTFITKGYS